MLSTPYIFKDGQFYDNNGRPIGLTPDLVRTFANLGASGQVQAAAGTGLKIRVYSLAVVVSAAMTFKLQSAASDITANWSLAANGGLVLPYNPAGWFETNANEALNGVLGSAGNAALQYQYAIVA